MEGETMQQTMVIGFALLVATFRTGDTEIFRVDPETGDARNLTRSPNSARALSVVVSRRQA